MATIDKRISPRTGKVTYRARVRRANLPDLTKSFPTKTKATQWAYSTEAALLEGRLGEASILKKYCLNDVFDLYELDIIKRLKDPFNRIRHLVFWRAEIGQIPLQDLSASAIRSPREK